MTGDIKISFEFFSIYFFVYTFSLIFYIIPFHFIFLPWLPSFPCLLLSLLFFFLLPFLKSINQSIHPSYLYLLTVYTVIIPPLRRSYQSKKINNRITISKKNMKIKLSFFFAFFIFIFIFIFIFLWLNLE